jgi:hypothetical protein
LPSVKELITIPSADNDLLIFLASSSVCPVAPVFPTYQSALAFDRYGSADLFRTSQIDKIEVSALLTSILGISLMDPNDED